MPHYTASEIAKIEIGSDDQALVDVNLFKADSITIGVVPVKSVVNGRQQATAKKRVTVTMVLHDLDPTVKGAIEGYEANFTPTYIKCTLLDSSKSFTTMPKLVNVEENYDNKDELVGYTVSQEYDIDRSQSPFGAETITTS